MNKLHFDSEVNKYNSGREKYKLEYQYSQYFINEKNSSEFYDRQKRGMSKLAMEVLYEELTPRQRQIFILVHAEGFSQTQVAQELGLNKSTVSRHLKLAQKKFDKAVKHFNCNQFTFEED